MEACPILKSEVLTFWLGSARGAQYSADAMRTASNLWWGNFETNELRDQFDEQIRSKFVKYLDSASKGELDCWQGDPEGVLAFCILCDQFSRNIYRGSAQAFAMDSKVLGVVKTALMMKMDEHIPAVERLFFYLPLVHSESLEDHKLALERYQDLMQAVESLPAHIAQTVQESMDFLLLHTSILERFGRYPHRNKVLGRVNTPEEEKYIHSSEFVNFGQ